MRLAAAIALLAIAGCAVDPFERTGTWSVPQDKLNSNDANLRVMVTDPADLVAGTGEVNSAGPAAVAPVRRLLTGKRAPLPQSNVSTIRTGGDAGAATPGAGAGTQPQE